MIMAEVEVAQIAGFLDGLLKPSDFADSSHNGLQVQNSGRVGVVCCGVDASLEFFEAARKAGAGLVICHHGISWGDSLKRITGVNYKRVSFLIENDIALYVSHLPLDAHPVHGNNALICKAIGLKKLTPFGIHGGRAVGFAGQLPAELDYEHFKKLVRREINDDIRTMDFGKKRVRSVAVISGGAAGDIEEAGRRNIDVFLSGEPNLAAYNNAMDYGINAIFAGHYATETSGVRALGALVKRKFKVESRFVDLRITF